MKILHFGILLALGATVNGQTDAAAKGQVPDIGVIDCDALQVVLGALKATEKAGEKAAEQAAEKAAEKEAEKEGEKGDSKPQTRQDASEDDKKKMEDAINDFLNSLPPTTKANVLEIYKQLNLGDLFALAASGNMTDYDFRKGLSDKITALGLDPKDVTAAIMEQCGNDNDGSNGDGSDDGGSSDDGSSNDGSNDDGSSNDGSDDDGSDDDGSYDDGSYDDGSSGNGSQQ